jgi:PTS system N-acetylglucosamine-specific IIC component
MTAVASDGLPPASRASGTFAMLQRIGRSLMLPIAALPAAALLLRLGSDDILGSGTTGLHLATHAHWLQHVADVLAAAGGALFDNLPLLFAVGVAVGFAKKSDGSTALAAVVGYLVFDRVTRVLFAGSSIKSEVVSTIDDKPKQLNMALHNPTWVLGGIVIGITAAVLWERYYRVKLPTYLAFFGGRRFVPIITAGAAVVIGVLFGVVWPPIGHGIENFGDWLTDQGAVGAGIYGVLNRALLPFGLHHIINSFMWFVFGTFKVGGQTFTGDLNRFFAGDPDAGTFMTGFFPVMMFGLPAAAIAIWRAAPPARRNVIGGIMLSAALASFLTGVTEPIEFSFLFVAPLLYAVHAVLTGLSLSIMELLNVKDGFGFSAGAIDYVINWGRATKPWMILIVGPIYAVVYYVVFTFAIKRFNLMTPGREPEADVDAGTPATAAQIPSDAEREPAAPASRDVGPGAAEPTG